MSECEKVQLPWQDIDTLLLDMDGTLLDLAFDNFFWNELVPAEYARATGCEPEAAELEVRERYRAVIGTLPWYSVDHWTHELGLDIEGLKRAHRHRIRFLPDATRFLDFARHSGKRLILVTNAHRVTLTIKCEQTRIDRWMDEVVSSHDFGTAKEEQPFWQRLEATHGFDRERSLLVEDNVEVLDVARCFGIAHTIAIAHPDSTQAPRKIEGFGSVAGVGKLIESG